MYRIGDTVKFMFSNEKVTGVIVSEPIKSRIDESLIRYQVNFTFTDSDGIQENATASIKEDDLSLVE